MQTSTGEHGWGGGGGERVADHVSVLIGRTQETELLSSTSEL